ncbi:F420-dependent methylenetetrahydromethanopterin dehydrogenase [Methanosphaera sp. WGK6]|uniref:F420-dependent methylenetetrahydromethanopterin dehydrogenase n=1 Tax=Methanosphaera sp. WGK6 TaxID=1561964 RepID=UPI00084CE425|nr:F420-dependent methylenetetrahydromethanopterin dehydrogenase [Methanosphaera sp. WGK6]OED29576.1 methylenetetrahydromethanopterin dehydrogenase [Methanosphaera sp. WGK6]
MVVKIGIIKTGTIGTSSLIELILDERADREDIDVRIVSSGAKMSKQQIEEVTFKINDFNPDIIIFISPNPNAKQPKNARKILTELEIPTIIIGDKPGEVAIPEIKEQKFGYIIIQADPMIGARREFLDPTEMVLFNADVLKVLAVTGVFRLIHKTLDNVIDDIKNNEPIHLPELLVTEKEAVDTAGFKNPYAKSKAIAAYNITKQVAQMNINACFKVKESDEYIPIVAAAHEMMSSAAKLADEARMIEKTNDSVLRTPHRRDGSTLSKTSLMDNFR